MKAISPASADDCRRRWLDITGRASPPGAAKIAHPGARVIGGTAAPTTGSPPVKAILCNRYGTADDLVLADIPDPVAGPGEVVAKVAAVGLNFFDTLIIAGKYQTKPPFPFSPGGEFAGVVESVGAGVTALEPGDRVMGYTNFNAARERTAVAADQLVKLAGRSRFRPRRRAHHHVRHRLPRARAPRPAASPARRWRCSAPPAASDWRRSSSAS